MDKKDNHCYGVYDNYDITKHRKSVLTFFTM